MSHTKVVAADYLFGNEYMLTRSIRKMNPCCRHSLHNLRIRVTKEQNSGGAECLYVREGLWRILDSFVIDWISAIPRSTSSSVKKKCRAMQITAFGR